MFSAPTLRCYWYSRAKQLPSSLPLLQKITDEALYAYNVYQIEGEGRKLFLNIEGDEDTIMGLPIKKIKQYLSNYEWKNI